MQNPKIVPCKSNILHGSSPGCCSASLFTAGERTSGCGAGDLALVFSSTWQVNIWVFYPSFLGLKSHGYTILLIHWYPQLHPQIWRLIFWGELQVAVLWGWSWRLVGGRPSWHRYLRDRNKTKLCFASFACAFLVGKWGKKVVKSIYLSLSIRSKYQELITGGEAMVFFEDQNCKPSFNYWFQ